MVKPADKNKTRYKREGVPPRSQLRHHKGSRIGKGSQKNFEVSLIRPPCVLVYKPPSNAHSVFKDGVSLLLFVAGFLYVGCRGLRMAEIGCH